MESFSPTASPLADRRAARLARVKFMALARAADDPPRRPARFLSFLVRLASRVIGRPVAARP